MESELLGESISLPALKTESDGKKTRGRRPEIDAMTLRRAVDELEFILEQNWGVVGWLLQRAETITEVQSALNEKIVSQRSRFLEPFTHEETQKTTASELRSTRKEIKSAEGKYRKHHAELLHAKESCERVFRDWATQSDQVKKARIHSLHLGQAQRLTEAESLECKSRLRLDTLRDQLRANEAFFVQSEILNFIRSRRGAFTPLNIARAMAGMPFLSARVSFEKCSTLDPKREDGFEFQTFQIIERALVAPVATSGCEIASMRKRLLKGRGKNLPPAVDLRDNWFFLEDAIRSEARDLDAPRESLAFRVFAKYKQRCSSHTYSDELFANAQRLIPDLAEE